MFIQKRWNLGLGTIFSLIVVYFIYLYSKDRGWVLMTFIAKWYLIIFVGFIALSLGIILLIVFTSLIMLVIAMLKLHSVRRTPKKRLSEDCVDAEFEVKE